MAIPEYADPRAHTFYTTGFVGSGHGDNGGSYATSWYALDADLRPTLTLKASRRPLCGYCGNTALPIQNRHRENWPTTGYTCCCSGAMDEREHQEALAAMKQRHHDEYQELLKQAPLPSEDAVKKMLADATARLERELLGQLRDGIKSVNGEPIGDRVAALAERLQRVCQR